MDDRQHKFEALDGMRGLAALFVMTGHTRAYLTFFLPRHTLGVDLFFLLSGFVIAHSYEQKLASGMMSRGRFVVVRLIRLYPTYLLSVMFAIVLSGAGLLPAIAGLFMLPTINEGSMFVLDAVYWSLFFELIVNALYVFARPALSRRLLILIVALAGVMTVYLARQHGGIYLGYLGQAAHFVGGFARAVFGISLGILIYSNRARLYAFVPSFTGPMIAIVAMCLVLSQQSIGHLDWLFDVFAVLIVFPACLLAATCKPATRWLGTMTMLGAASYPFYLFHPLLGEMNLRLFPIWIAAHAPWSGAIFVAVALGFSLGVYRLDATIRRLLTRLSVRPGFLIAPH